MSATYYLEIDNKNYSFSQLMELASFLYQQQFENVDVYYLGIAKISLNLKNGEVHIDSVQEQDVSNSFGLSNQDQVLISFVIIAELLVKQYLLNELKKIPDKDLQHFLNQNTLPFERTSFSIEKMLQHTNKLLQKIETQKYHPKNNFLTLFKTPPPSEMQQRISHSLNEIGITNIKSLNDVKTALDLIQNTKQIKTIRR